MYDWFKDYTVNDFEKFKNNKDTQEFVCDPGDADGTNELAIFLINYQEGNITKIKNKEVLDFFYNNVYMPTINKTYIDGHIELGKFKLKEWK